jgi:hypothetical protein
MFRAFSGCNEAFEETRAINTAHQRINEVFGMGHHAKHIALV